MIKMIQPLILHRFVEDIMFKEYQKLTKQKLRLETIVRNLFKESDSLEGFKLVGSASTGTMRKDTPDLDYVVLFKHKLFYKDFATKLVNSILSPNKINYEDKYDYVKVSGHFEGFKYVFVPSTNPNGIIKDYVDDAFYHPDFINKHKNRAEGFSTTNVNVSGYNITIPKRYATNAWINANTRNNLSLLFILLFSYYCL